MILVILVRSCKTVFSFGGIFFAEAPRFLLLAGVLDVRADAESDVRSVSGVKARPAKLALSLLDAPPTVGFSDGGGATQSGVSGDARLVDREGEAVSWLVGNSKGEKSKLGCQLEWLTVLGGLS